jgi:hypothetical protein
MFSWLANALLDICMKAGIVQNYGTVAKKNYLFFWREHIMKTTQAISPNFNCSGYDTSKHPIK